MSRPLAIGAVAILLLAAGAIGYLVGLNGAPDDAEARLAQSASYGRALPIAERQAFLGAKRSGFEAGLAEGERRGESQGAKRGENAGEEAAAAKEKRLAAEKEAAELAEREAAQEAEAEAAEARSCNVPLFIDGYCPTQAEIEQENQAEGEAGIGD